MVSLIIRMRNMSRVKGTSWAFGLAAYLCACVQPLRPFILVKCNMQVNFVISLSLLATAALVQGQEVVQPGPPDFCLEGPFHKDVPSPEEEQFHECLSWQNEACCNLQLSMTIDRHKAVGLYNYSWDICGTLSPQCEEFIKVHMHNN